MDDILYNLVCSLTVHDQGYLTCVVMVTYVLDRLDKLYFCNVTINKIPFLGFSNHLQGLEMFQLFMYES